MARLEFHAEKTLLHQRKATQNLIIVDGRDIALIRSTKVEDGAGGWISTGETTLPPVRRYFNAKRREPGETPDNTKRYEYVLIGTHMDDIRDGDDFVIDNRRYHVEFVYEDKSYQVKAEVFTNAS